MDASRRPLSETSFLVWGVSGQKKRLWSSEARFKSFWTCQSSLQRHCHQKHLMLSGQSSRAFIPELEVNTSKPIIAAECRLYLDTTMNTTIASMQMAAAFTASCGPQGRGNDIVVAGRIAVDIKFTIWVPIKPPCMSQSIGTCITPDETVSYTSFWTSQYRTQFCW